MIKRFDQKKAFFSFIKPAFFYLSIALLIFLLSKPYVFEVSNELIISIALIGIWRYSLMIINYIRAAIYAWNIHPKYIQRIQKLDKNKRYPKHLYFIIPTYKEDAWVTVEVFQALFSDINNISIDATVIVSTGSDYDDSIIRNIYDSYPNTDKIHLVLQRQDSGKRIAMGHALRSVSRSHNNINEDSITIFMDGDTYLPLGTLENSLPFFAIEKNVGAVTTNEIAYINSKSRWYKDWFNLKFGQRHILFQSQSVSKRVLTLTGRFSIFRTSAIVTEDFISMIEHDIIIDASYGKFRFLMGDDKSSWYNLMKNGWEMLYLPDVLIYSLESRDGDFLDVSQSLPYRWYGNTLRNNKRARSLKNQPLFIKYLFWDQLALMWTSLVGITAAVFLSIFVNVIYLPLYFSWVLLVRVIQMCIVAYTGHQVSMRTVPLMLYSQWIGSVIKIKAFFHLSDQKWSKNGTEIQTANKDSALIEYAFAKYFSPYRMYLFVLLFIFSMLTLYTNILSIPSIGLIASEIIPSKSVFFQADVNDGKDDAKALNAMIQSVDDNTSIFLPKGVLDIYEPIVIRRNNIKIIGDETIFLSHLKSKDKAIVIISGTRGEYLGKTLSSLYNQTLIKVDTKRALTSKELILIEQTNDRDYVQGVLGAKKWYREFPKLRSEIIEVARYTQNELIMSYRSHSLIDENASMYEINPINNISLENITIDSIVKSDFYNGIYKNSRTDLMVNGIDIFYGSYINLKNISIKNSGSNPLVFERAYHCYAEHISIDGSVNKGTNGNGYLRFNKSFYNELHNISVKNIRHITFQWGSAYNRIDNLYTEVDLNFHGGGTHDNLISNVEFNVDIKKHKWGNVYRTPDNAKWAPPDFKTNRVKEKL
ncbi:MAG: glycosyltransferase [Campylobacterota bacterium]|nr:glycosyltransferase [Campylobacterota bacterium]